MKNSEDFFFVTVVEITTKCLNVTIFRGPITKVNLDLKCSVGGKLRNMFFGTIFFFYVHNVHVTNWILLYS